MPNGKLNSQIAYLISQNIMGRRTIAGDTGYTESVVRTQLEKLKDKGWVKMSKQGTELTGEGRRRYQEVLEKVREIKSLSLGKLRVDQFNIACRMEAGEKLKTWSIRDLAVKEGATGAVFISCMNNQLKFADSDQNLSERNPQDADAIKGAFPDRKNGELIVIIFGPDKGKVNQGLWKIIIELLRMN